MRRQGGGEEPRRPSRIGARQRAADREHQRGPRRELTEHVERPEPRPPAEQQERHGLEGDEGEHHVHRPSGSKEAVQGPARAQGVPSPSRWAMSFMKIRKWAAGLLRTSSLFM